MISPVVDDKGRLKGISAQLPFTSFQLGFVHVQSNETLLVRTLATQVSVGSSRVHRLTKRSPQPQQRSLMKTGSLLLGLCFCIAVASSFASKTTAARARNSKDPDTAPSLGLRLVLDDSSYDPNAFCKHDERAKMRHVLWDAIGHPIRKMRSSRSTDASDCAQFCDGKSPGHCMLGHAVCHGWRRQEQTSAVDGSLINPSASSTADLHRDKLFALVQRGRFLATKKVISGSMKLKCKEAVDELLAGLKAKAGGFAAPCQRLLQKQISISCFIL